MAAVFESFTRMVTPAMNPWWTGTPTQLLRKKTLIPASSDHLPVHTLTFGIPKNAIFSGRAKSHNEVRMDMGDVVKMVIPGYKPKSYSMSALREEENEFDVTFKVYPNGRASGYLDRLKVGDEINTFGMSSKRVYQPGKYVGIVAYGVGITEGLPVARAELEKGNAEHVVLLWASRTMDDTFWLDEVKQLQKDHPDKFQMKFILSREQKDDCLHGRIDADILADVFDCESVGVDRNDARFLSVGTKDMMRMTDGLFAQMGFPMPQHGLIPKV